MSHLFSQYIKIIGKGQKGSRSLTQEEAFTAMSMLLKGEITPDQRGAFLMLLRTREETPEEITGFIQACRQYLEPGTANIQVKLDIGCYAGKRRQLPWYLLAVACLVTSGTTVFLHGAEEPGSGRMYASHVLPTLGLPTVESIPAAAGQIRAYGVSYLDMNAFLPPLNKVIKLREEFGLRSCANTLARLLNPSGAPFSVQGVYHMHLDHKHTRVNEQFPAYDSLCFRGDGGDPEVNSERPTELFFTRQGNTKAIMLPESNTGWAMKDKDMDVKTMLAVWRKEKAHKYAEQSVSATLTSYLMLTENLDVAEAQSKSRQLWESRDVHRLPFSACA
ncbi:glycosyl transferase family protein [Alteromonas pelagimontana]|uniref:Glycosyl transferase family protein n=1 Tax=Alteromonas pelagimontana TaxID=1858656 RepID=A0A6M4MBD8_9ALTE|nr:glycosyl transferase family protein [Alteromonas pelagimontana]QJR80339.1 glycosyl transferase family protein [Alteromonas pelagimontana]